MTFLRVKAQVQRNQGSEVDARPGEIRAANVNERPGRSAARGGAPACNGPKETAMESERIIGMKAKAFDRVVALYKELERTAGFASSSWVIFSEALEAEVRKIEESGS